MYKCVYINKCVNGYINTYINTYVYTYIQRGNSFNIAGRNNEKFSGLIQDAATVQVILITEKIFWGLSNF